MTDHAGRTGTHHQQHIPRGILAGAGALVLFVLMAAALGSWSGMGMAYAPTGDVLREVNLRVSDRDDGSLSIVNADDGKTIHIVQAGEDGFIRATLRGLVRDRKRAGFGDDVPFKLAQWSDGALTVSDKTTNRRINLEAFGATNAGAFARFLDKRSVP
jgi:putative photosynthetic complex assembly protein